MSMTKIGPQIVKIDENACMKLMDLFQLMKLMSKLDLEIDSENYDTISGFLIDEMGIIPSESDNRKGRI
jgi:putative hemolysin